MPLKTSQAHHLSTFTRLGLSSSCALCLLSFPSHLSPLIGTKTLTCRSYLMRKISRKCTVCLRLDQIHKVQAACFIPSCEHITFTYHVFLRNTLTSSILQRKKKKNKKNKNGRRNVVNFEVTRAGLSTIAKSSTDLNP